MSHHTLAWGLHSGCKSHANFVLPTRGVAHFLVQLGENIYPNFRLRQTLMSAFTLKHLGRFMLERLSSGDA